MKLFTQKGFEETQGYKVFLNDNKAIEEFIQSKKSEITLLNNKGTSSKQVQDYIFEGVIKSLGYGSEIRQGQFIPDFIKETANFGIMIEVERGKTINNNMDFIDFWKCHINRKANMLILIVPQRVPRAKDKSMNIYSFVLRRMEPLFEEQNYTNVKALSVIPY